MEALQETILPRVARFDEGWADIGITQATS